MFAWLRRLRRVHSSDYGDGSCTSSPANFFKADFDADWYAREYPDIADAGMDPWEHFTGRGLAEGRLPCASRAAILDYRLWQGMGELVVDELEEIAAGDGPAEEAIRAAWALQRWNFGKGDMAAPEIKQSIQRSRWFDPLWYLGQYADVLYSTIDPLTHYWQAGAFEGRDPGPGFSSSGYLYSYPGARASGLSPLAHFLSEGESKGYQRLPELEGQQAWVDGATTLMVCGHQVGPQLYGAERSLLDVLAAFNRLNVNLVVTLPNATNAEYVDAVRATVQKVVILPYGWWRQGHKVCQETIEYFKIFLEEYRVAAVYANTSVLHEPLEAASELNIPRLVHVRELPQWDDSLCKLLNTDADAFLERIRFSSDIVVANSLAVANAIGKEVAVVPNIINVSDYADLTDQNAPEGDPVRVALISSNLPKKGLDDFVAVAQLLHDRCANIRCVIVGPENAYTESIRIGVNEGALPGNIVLTGYANSPVDALSRADIVVNLSHFQESFGRTVLEAMAAAKPVVAYRHGALPELVDQGKTGFLVSLGDLESVAQHLMELADNSELRRAMGLAGRFRAASDYNADVLAERLRLLKKRIEVLSRHL